MNNITTTIHIIHIIHSATATLLGLLVCKTLWAIELNIVLRILTVIITIFIGCILLNILFTGGIK